MRIRCTILIATLLVLAGALVNQGFGDESKEGTEKELKGTNIGELSTPCMSHFYNCPDGYISLYQSGSKCIGRGSVYDGSAWQHVELVSYAWYTIDGYRCAVYKLERPVPFDNVKMRYLAFSDERDASGKYPVFWSIGLLEPPVWFLPLCEADRRYLTSDKPASAK
jgi:hypothetical protein